MKQLMAGAVALFTAMGATANDGVLSGTTYGFARYVEQDGDRLYQNHRMWDEGINYTTKAGMPFIESVSTTTNEVYVTGVVWESTNPVSPFESLVFSLKFKNLSGGKEIVLHSTDATTADFRVEEGGYRSGRGYVWHYHGTWVIPFDRLSPAMNPEPLDRVSWTVEATGI